MENLKGETAYPPSEIRHGRTERHPDRLVQEFFVPIRLLQTLAEREWPEEEDPKWLASYVAHFVMKQIGHVPDPDAERVARSERMGFRNVRDPFSVLMIRIFQVVWELLMNAHDAYASKYPDARGAEWMREVRVRWSVDRTKRRIMLVVRDEGAGNKMVDSRQKRKNRKKYFGWKGLGLGSCRIFTDDRFRLVTTSGGAHAVARFDF